MREFYEDLKAHRKLRREENYIKYKPLLEEQGAKLLSEGVYYLRGYFCYPYKGYARLKANIKLKLNLEKLLKENKND